MNIFIMFFYNFNILIFKLKKLKKKFNIFLNKNNFKNYYTIQTREEDNEKPNKTCDDEIH